jgi:bifunctional DNA-binding transcriptional regulator/antitoxin component of YhaV-PrlF toxin-antitoxin module
MTNGKIGAMKLRMDPSGRIVFPKPLRQRLGLERAGELEAIEQAEGVLLRPVKQKPSMLRLGGVWVHQGIAEPGADWQHLVEEVREERLRHILKPS